jgi:hypothetical protein
LLTELCHLSGALGRAPEGGGTVSKLEVEFGMVGIGVTMSPELGEALPGALDRLYAAIEPWAAEGGCFNFAERPC